MTPSEQIKSIRARTGLSQAAFAAEYELPRRTVEDWEAGRRSPTPWALKLLDRLTSIDYPAL